jgi:TonB family protein
MILRVSLVVSFVFHVIIILAIQKAFPFSFHWAGEELRTYRVELVRPPVEGLDINDISDTDISQIKEEEPPSPDDDQETISLDTVDKRYISYAGIIKGGIIKHWKYPEEAKENLIEGKLMVIFSLAKQGNLTQIEIISSSGYEILDEEALRAVSAAAPFPTFPEHITVSRLNVKANFNYRLASRK